MITLYDIHGELVPTAATHLTLDPGEERSITMEWETTIEDAGEGSLTVSSWNDQGSTFVELTHPPYFAVSIEQLLYPEVDDDGEFEPGEEIGVVATIENLGDTGDRQEVVLRNGESGDVQDRARNVRLDAGESTEVHLEWAPDDFHITETYPQYVASSNDSDTATFRTIQDTEYYVQMLSSLDVLYPGQIMKIQADNNIQFAILNWQYDAYYAMDASGSRGDLLYYESSDLWDGHRGWVNANTDWAHRFDWLEPGVISLYPICNDETCDYDAVPYLKADDSASAGESRRVCYETWPATARDDDTRPGVRMPTTTVDAEPDNLYDSICHTIEIAPEDDDRVELTGRITLEFYDAHGNRLDAGEGMAMLEGDQYHTNLEGEIKLVDLPADYYAIEANAFESEEEKLINVNLHDHESITEELQFDDIYPTGDVIIQVKDSTTGDPISLASVELGDEQEFTDTSGQVRFEEVEADVEHTVIVAYDGSVESKSVSVSEGDLEREEVYLDTSATGKLHVSVENEIGGSLSGATVEEDALIPSFSGTTNSVGEVQFTNVDPGTYHVEAEYNGGTSQGTVDILEDETAELTMVIYTGVGCPGCIAP